MDVALSVLPEQSAKHAGFKPAPRPLLGQTFILGGEVSPSVQVFLQCVTDTDVAPYVYFGVYVEAFEQDWHDRLLRTDVPPESEGLPLSLHSLNMKSLSPRPWCPIPASVQDAASVREWLDRAFEYARRLPSSIDSLVAAIEANRIVDHILEAYLAHPVRVRGLLQWLRREHGVSLEERVLPLLSDRTGLYDVQMMLGDQ